jgi:hypothetical protein
LGRAAGGERPSSVASTGSQRTGVEVTSDARRLPPWACDIALGNRHWRFRLMPDAITVDDDDRPDARR